jgi:predicted glycosyltransferase
MRILMYHHHEHQGLGHLARSVSRVTAALASVSSVFQLFSFLVDCSGMILKGFGVVVFFASVRARER